MEFLGEAVSGIGSAASSAGAGIESALGSLFGSPMSSALAGNPATAGISPSMVSGVSATGGGGAFTSPAASGLSVPNIINPSTATGQIAMPLMANASSGANKSQQQVMEAIKQFLASMQAGGRGGI